MEWMKLEFKFYAFHQCPKYRRSGQELRKGVSLGGDSIPGAILLQEASSSPQTLSKESSASFISCIILWNIESIDWDAWLTSSSVDNFVGWQLCSSISSFGGDSKHPKSVARNSASNARSKESFESLLIISSHKFKEVDYFISDLHLPEQWFCKKGVKIPRE